MFDGLLLALSFILSTLPLCYGFATGKVQDGEASLRKVCFVLDESFEPEGKGMASSLQIPYILPDDDDKLLDFDHLLRFVPYQVGNDHTTYALALESVIGQPSSRAQENPSSIPRRKKPKQKQIPFFIDLCPSEKNRLGRRGSHERGGDLLVKAVGPRKSSKDEKQGAIIYDLTAGLGQDALVLAQNGAQEVHMMERDPIVVALLRDALRRLDIVSSLPGVDDRANLARELSKKLFLHPGDSVDVMSEILQSRQTPPPDITYLDPMFPPRTKSAKVKKGMALLHNILETQKTDLEGETRRLEDETCLLEKAYNIATRRVVVKRPIHALSLGGKTALRPSYAIEGTLNRWDVYVK